MGKEEMTGRPRISKDSVVVLRMGGPLPSWEELTATQQSAYSQEHVELMLGVAKEHGLMRLEGFKLVAPQPDWVRFWVAEFPDLEGAEAWTEAEVLPPYGRHQSHEYHLARRWGPEYFAEWVANPREARAPQVASAPEVVPELDVDWESFVVLLFGRALPEAEDATPEERGESEHIDLMKSVAREHGMMTLEAYRLMAPIHDWHRAWVIEFPTLAGAEAWMAGELTPPHSRFARKSMFLARRWAPEYFETWVVL